MKTRKRGVTQAVDRDEKLRRKLYRRINWIKNNPRKERLIGLATDELHPVYCSGNLTYLLFRSVHGKTYAVELVSKNELPDLYFTDKDLNDMGFIINTAGYAVSITE